MFLQAVKAVLHPCGFPVENKMRLYFAGYDSVLR